MKINEILYTDVLIAGAGIAGVKAACTAAQNGLKVMLVTKSMTAASDYVLGFNAVLSESDSVQLYYNDTLNGGGNINNKDLVRLLAENASKEVKAVEEVGLEFDKEDGKYHLLKPLGCSSPRLAHIQNITGKLCLEKYRDIARDLGVDIKNNIMLADVLTDGENVTGAMIFDLEEKKIKVVSAKAVIIATGGIHIAKDSTYPIMMTGDGYGAAYRAGAELTDMEFIQFEPCRCIYPQKLGISTTLLAKGGTITNKHGERFLLKHYKCEGDIPKDALAQLIYAEILKGNGTEHGGVYLDLTDIPEDEIVQKHALYYNRFKNAGIDITKEKVEVAPCAHSFMGGIVVDKHCKTNVNGLFAAGEAIGGLHGANRVGGNAGTEIYVFGTVSGNSASEFANSHESLPIKHEIEYKISSDGNSKEYFEDLKKKIQSVMNQYMGPVRCETTLLEAEKILGDLEKSIIDTNAQDFDALVSKKECENMIIVCKASCKSAILRKESRGVHTRSDYADTLEEYSKNFVYTKGQI